jgi:hypothetical protein
VDHGDGIVRDANGYAYKDGITPLVARQQKVLNESWPQRDADGSPHARGVSPAVHADGSPWTIDVDARIELNDDGEVILPGRAERWTKTHVYVVVTDPRVPWGKVWLSATDVRRR